MALVALCVNEKHLKANLWNGDTLDEIIFFGDFLYLQ